MAGRRRSGADRYGRDHALSLPEQARYLGCVVGVPLGQHVRCDLAGVCVHGQVKLAPGAGRPAMLLGVPLALAEQFQARAVQHEVDRASTGQHTRLPSCERPAAAAQRRMVRDRQRQPEQAQHTAAERLRLSQGQVEHEPQGQHEFDGQLGIQRLPAGRTAPTTASPPTRPPRDGSPIQCRRSSSRPGHRRCQARTGATAPARARVTATSNLWPSAVVWAGKGRPSTAGAIRSKRPCSGINTSSAPSCAPGACLHNRARSPSPSRC